MQRQDLYYRAFRDYRKNTVEDSACARSRKELAKAGAEEDKLETTKYLCTIDEDWVQAIEEGLPYVEKAVAEERQFIRVNGEVVPIEKIKRISKDSVSHLARHSELLTHIPENEGDDIVPDQLYMVEKLSDYAVYENRFLYMMLCYLNNFINFRLEKIEELRHTYLGEFSQNKKVIAKKSKLTVQINIIDSRTDNEYPLADDKSSSVLGRIKDCRSIVNALLDTDLMQQVAKSPMIKPPITKTNVLKMNNSFKKALALYDYIASYKGDGFTYEEVKHSHAPFNDTLADEFAESANLMTFLTYKFGNDLEGILETSYNEEETRRKAEEGRKLVDRLKRLKKRALENNKTLEEYMLVLEERNRSLEQDSEELQLVRHEVETLNRRIGELSAEKVDLNRRIDSLLATIDEKELEIERLNLKYTEDMAALRQTCENEKQELTSQYEQQISSMQAEFDEKTAAAEEAHNARVQELNQKIESLQRQWDAAQQQLEADREEVRRRTENLDNERKKYTDECDRKLEEAKKQCDLTIADHDKKQIEELKERDEELYMIRAELDGLRVQVGSLLPSTDYTSRDRFIELEKEYKMFRKFFKGQWKLTKRAIRKEVFAEAKAKHSKQAEKTEEIKPSEEKTPSETKPESGDNQNN